MNQCREMQGNHQSCYWNSRYTNETWLFEYYCCLYRPARLQTAFNLTAQVKAKRKYVQSYLLCPAATACTEAEVRTHICNINTPGKYFSGLSHRILYPILSHKCSVMSHTTSQRQNKPAVATTRSKKIHLL